MRPTPRRADENTVDLGNRAKLKPRWDVADDLADFDWRLQGDSYVVVPANTLSVSP